MTTPRWPMFNHVLRRHALMDETMEAAGVDLLTAVRASEAFVAARSKCRACLNEAACRNWFLAGAGKPQQLSEFCPNVEFFRACKREDR